MSGSTLGLIALLMPAFATAAMTGTFDGSGRACYGRLVITSSAVSWVTPATNCKRSGYQRLEESAAPSRAVLQLRHAGNACTTPVIVLRQHASSGSDAGWEAIGYPSLAAFKADDDASALSCALIRVK